MIMPEIPDDEHARLENLCALQVLDTPPEERFDSITRQAAKVFKAPIVLVSLIDAQRQWFKSRHGLDITETERSISFCGHTIYQRAPLVVPDATQDERFSNNPLVTGEPFIRFYAGYPLKSVSGHVLGTLTLIDTKPRVEKDVDLGKLSVFAMAVESELKKR